MESIILLHGAIGAKNQLLSLAEILKVHIDVHLIEFSGHGSSNNSCEFSIQEFSNDIINYIRLFPDKKFHVFGYSMGGYVALYTELKHPGTFSSIFTYGTKFKWDKETAEKEIKLLNPEKIQEKIPAFANELAIRHGKENWKDVLHKTAQMMLKMGENPPLNDDDFSKIKIPVIITWGDADKMVSKEESVKVKNRLSNGFFKSYTNWPHPIEKLDYKALANDIERFTK
ncbi:MAG: alpha/beta fold hydrolase [Bacteroidia bacterium]